jgi:hypothetical protein
LGAQVALHTSFWEAFTQFPDFIFSRIAGKNTFLYLYWDTLFKGFNMFVLQRWLIFSGWEKYWKHLNPWGRSGNVWKSPVSTT